MLCKDCKHRSDKRHCENDSAMSEDYNQGFGDNDNMMIYPYVESGWFEVGDNFGCVHFEGKAVQP